MGCQWIWDILWINQYWNKTYCIFIYIIFCKKESRCIGRHISKYPIKQLVTVVVNKNNSDLENYVMHPSNSLSRKIFLLLSCIVSINICGSFYWVVFLNKHHEIEIKFNSNSISYPNFNFKFQNFKSPAPSQVHKKVNKEVNKKININDLT